MNILKKLKRTFVLLCMALTGLVLLVACALGFVLSNAQIESATREAFEYQSQTLSVLLAGTKQLSHNQIYRMEKEGNVIIFLFDNDNPLHIASACNDEERTALYDDALAALTGSGGNISINPKERNGEPVSISAGFTAGSAKYLTKFISTPTGTRQWYSIVLIKPVQAQSGEIICMASFYTLIFIVGLATLFLISRVLAKRSVQPVEKAQEKQREFIAAASHELKSPLAVIVSCADVIENNPLSAANNLPHIRSEAKRASSLVEDMLILAGADTGKWTIKKAPTNMEDVLAAAYEHYLPLAKKKGQTLTLHLPENSLPVIMADEERLVQILSILLSNAISYSAHNTEIVLSGRFAKKELELAVQDNGMGIPDKEKDTVFDSFYRAEHCHTDKSHFGLGLAVAKELVTLHGGTIRISDTPGGGATFTIILPKENEES